MNDDWGALMTAVRRQPHLAVVDVGSTAMRQGQIRENVLALVAALDDSPRRHCAAEVQLAIVLLWIRCRDLHCDETVGAAPGEALTPLDLGEAYRNGFAADRPMDDGALLTAAALAVAGTQLTGDSEHELCDWAGSLLVPLCTLQHELVSYMQTFGDDPAVATQRLLSTQTSAGGAGRG